MLPAVRAGEDHRPVVHPQFVQLAQDFCVGCHNPEKRKGKFDLEALLGLDPAANIDEWEEVYAMIADREMPPVDEPDVKRPTEDEYQDAEMVLESLMEQLVALPREVHFAKKDFVGEYCVSCHNVDDEKGGLVLEGRNIAEPNQDPEVWERVVRRLHARQMPPANRERPSEKTYESVLAELVGSLDAAAVEHPKPGRTETFRRLNRTEYQNAIRDLLAVQIDASALLPKDESSHGFDNVTVGMLSPTLLDRYISAAQKISRLAVGTPLSAPQGEVFRVRPDLTQERHIEGLPIGTQGGALIDYTFPRTGEYEIVVRLARDRNEYVEGLEEVHDMDILLDRELVERFVIAPPNEEHPDHSSVDYHLRVRTMVEAGPHQVGVTFPEQPYTLLETKRKPHTAHFNHHRHPRRSPAVYQISITGPFDSVGAGDTPSREKIFVSQPAGPDDEERAAREILANLVQRAYRRPVGPEDLARPMEFYREGAGENGFEAGIESALSAILVSPEFLFRIERDPTDVVPGGVYEVSDIELASRLSFFIWSSIPDDELLDHAIAGRLKEPDVLENQVRRMLTDPKAESLVTNFADQWLYLRNLESISPDQRLFPDFDDNLRQAFRKETELFFQSVLVEDRSVLDLLKADYTFLNERLAEHYGVPHVFGSRFRRVELDPEFNRGGILRHGSVLTVTSYATRTAPTIRGNWILENIVGTPPPPPPPDVPALEDKPLDINLSMRERLAEHRANPNCASCHDIMDPVGFALENFDAVGRWRSFDQGRPIDAAGGLPDGSEFSGVARLEEGLLERPELFVRTLSEKLLTYALGRGVESYDAPAIRQVVRDAKADDYTFSSIILGLVKSVPFQMRAVPDAHFATNETTP